MKRHNKKRENDRHVYASSLEKKKVFSKEKRQKSGLEKLYGERNVSALYTHSFGKVRCDEVVYKS